MSNNYKYNQYSPYINDNNDNYYYTENVNQIENDGNNNEFNHSFDNNLEVINIKNRIDPTILKQYLLFRQFEKNEQMEEIRKEKRKLKRSISYFKKEKEKFNKEKVLFLQSRDRVIRDNRKNEKKLLQFEKDLKNQYLKKKNELKEIKNKLKNEKINLENEKKKLNNIIKFQDLNKENEINNILNNQQNEINNKENHINQLNIQIKQKEKKINELNNKYNILMKNLNVSENNISNISNNDNDINKESFPEDTFDDIKDGGGFPENSKDNIFDDDYMKTPHDTFIEDDDNNEKDITGENFPNNSNKSSNNLQKIENEDNLNLQFNTLNNNFYLDKKKTKNYDFNFDSEDTDINQEELIIEEYNSSLGLCTIDNPNYMNAIIQCFAHIPEITQSIININNIEPNFKSKLSNSTFLKCYRELLINLFLPHKVHNNTKKPYNPIQLRNLFYEINPIFKDNKYIAYVEFIGVIIQKLHEELNINRNENEIINNENKIEKMNENEVYKDFIEKLSIKNNSQISKYLYGTIKSSLYCHKCQNTFYFFQPYSYLYFSLLNVLEYKNNKYKKEYKELNLFDCLEYYQRSEKMEGDKSFFCPNCKVKNESTSIKNIYSLNTILIITLDYYKKNINDNKIYFDFEENINLKDYIQKDNIDNNEKFFLSGIINSYEDNYGNITYKAFCKVSKNNVWYCYDNESVYPIDFKDIKKNGYPIALFYHKLFKV